jgi:hypothetical protein
MISSPPVKILDRLSMSQPLTRCGEWEMAQAYFRVQIENSGYHT